MTALQLAEPVAEAATAPPMLDIVIPVHNEEATLRSCVERVHACLLACPWTFRITVADNASTDRTAAIAGQLRAELAGVRVLRLAQKGRGRALRAAWSSSDAAVLAYMDADLSTDLKALLPLVAPLVSGHSDLAIGTRLARSARTVRGPKREMISRSYNLLLRAALGARFSDAQCGFKAVRAEVAASLLPIVRDQAWFFDTELLVLAQRAGLRIHEVPVDWVDDPDSSVDIVRTVLEDLRGIGRIGWSLVRGELPLGAVAAAAGRSRAEAAGGRLTDQVAVFAVVGAYSTVVYAVLYLLLRGWLPAGWANGAALVLTTVANTAANRRLTFGVSGPARLLRQHLQGLGVMLAGLAATSAALAALHLLAGEASRWWELGVLTLANLGVTVGRFCAMRWWMFAGARASVAARGTGAPPGLAR